MKYAILLFSHPLTYYHAMVLEKHFNESQCTLQAILKAIEETKYHDTALCLLNIFEENIDNEEQFSNLNLIKWGVGTVISYNSCEIHNVINRVYLMKFKNNNEDCSQEKLIEALNWHENNPGVAIEQVLPMMALEK